MKDHKERIEGFTKNFSEALTSLYDQGFADASKDIDAKVDDAYERGCDETVTRVWETGFDDGYEQAWTDAGRFVYIFLSLDIPDREEIFKDPYLSDLLKSHSLKELYKMYCEWAKDKKENPEFKVGDVVSAWEFGKAVILHTFKNGSGVDQFLLYNGVATDMVTKDKITKIGHSDGFVKMCKDIKDINDLPF